MPLKVIFYSHKGKNMLPIFFPLTGIPFKTCFSRANVETESTVQKLVYLYRYQHIKDVSIYSLLCN